MDAGSIPTPACIIVANADVAELVDATDLRKLSLLRETKAVQPLKFGETSAPRELRQMRVMVAIPSQAAWLASSYAEGVETRRAAPVAFLAMVKV
ncbi:MAG: hypothetical protein ACNYPG_05925 [Candidatus Porifericomitaceae bacterium WSBS_2022_MAG_OTU9]